MKIVPRRIYGASREDVIVDGIYDLYCTLDVIRGMKSGVRQAGGRRGMSGDMFILFEMIPCEGVEWIHLRN
jgi:hypothetical protein